jgi:putative phosphoribosyl transferase
VFRTLVAFRPARVELHLVFASRDDAGRKLGRWLEDRGVKPGLILGLPRGGVVVAAAVAECLGLPLDVLMVRKIGHPAFREFALGALAEAGVIVLDEQAARHGPGLDIEPIIHEEQENLRAYQSRFAHSGKHAIALLDVLLVDDGIATGATTEAAVRSAIKQGASSVTIAAPVGSANAVERLRAVADDVLVMTVDPKFEAVGRYYDAFPQTTDEEVLELLAGSRNRLSRH